LCPQKRIKLLQSYFCFHCGLSDPDIRFVPAYRSAAKEGKFCGFAVKAFDFAFGRLILVPTYLAL